MDDKAKEPVVVQDSDAFSLSSLDSTNRNEESQKAEIEILARKRPDVFSTTVVEIGFVAAIVLSLMMSEYFTSGFNIILPSLSNAIELPETARTWPTAVPNLAAAALLLPFARLCNMLGARQIFLYGHIWLLFWSVASGFSTDHVVLIICRAMQGIGFAAFLPAGLALMGQVYRPGPRKNMVYSIYGAFACLGFYFGIIVAALTTEFINWRWYFWTGAIFEFVTLVVAYLAIPRGLNDTQRMARMDWPGLCTIIPGMSLFIFAFTEGSQAPQGWKTPYVLVTLILGALLLLVAVYTQGWVSSQPLVPIAIFRIKFMKRLLGGMICFFGVCALFLLYSSLYIQDILLVTPIQAAAWYTPMVIGSIILAVCSGLILHLFSSRMLLLISSVSFLFSVLMFALIPLDIMQTHAGSTALVFWAYVFPAMCCGTLAIDLTFNVMNIFITTAMPKRDQAAVGALTNTLIYLGSSFWLGISELVVSTARNWLKEGLSLAEEYKTSFWLGVGLTALAFCLTITIQMGSASAELTSDEKEALVD